MDTPQNNNASPDFGTIPKSEQASSETFGNLPNQDETTSEPFRSVPKQDAEVSEGFGNPPAEASATIRKPRTVSERTAHHTLTVRDVARMFEEAGVTRTERSVINWCQPNRQGITRLDAYFDENEHRYYITAQSVTRAIEEDRARLNATQSAASEIPSIHSETNNAFPNQHEAVSENTNPHFRTLPKNDAPISEPFGNAQKSAHHFSETFRATDPESETEIADLRRKIMDLEITNRVKEQLLDRLNDELIKRDEERRTYIERLITDNRRIGELESQILQIGAPVQSKPELPHRAEVFRTETNDIDGTSGNESHVESVQ
jgi:hypothetical protein